MRCLLAFFLLSLIALSGSTSAFAAARFDAFIDPENIGVAKGQHPTEQQPIRVYATITNLGTEDIEGLVRFFDNDQFIGGKVFSLRAGIRPEDAWVLWTPKTSGEHTIRVHIVNDAEFPDATPANNTATTVFIVHQDLDKDGTANEYDDDIDGDTVSNTREESQGTNIYKPDTDEDGTSDARDTYPLDPTRQQAPPPPPPAPTPEPTPTAPPTPAPAPKLTPAKTAPVATKTVALSAQPLPVAQLTPSTPETPTSSEAQIEPSVVSTTVSDPAPGPLIVSPESAPAPVPTIKRTTWHNQPTARALAVAAGLTATAGLSALGISFFLRKPM